jgi:hypothetical protein
MSVCRTDALAAWRSERMWCTREDLNLHALRRPLLRRLRLPFRHECTLMVPQRRIERRLPPYQSGALPLDDCGLELRLVLAGGLEPPASRLQGECSSR